MGLLRNGTGAKFVANESEAQLQDLLMCCEVDWVQDLQDEVFSNALKQGGDKPAELR